MHSDEGMSYSQGISMLTEKTLDAHGYAYTYAYPSLVPLINAVLFKVLFIPITWILFFLNRIPQLVDGMLQIVPSQLERDRIFQVFILGKGGINPLYWGRLIASFFGFGSVILSYILGKKAFDKRVGLIWAFFMAVNWRLVLASHLDLPDIYNVFFLLLSMIFSLKITEKRNYKNYLLAGVFSGIAFSIKFQTFSFMCLAVCYLYSVFKFKKIDWKFVLTSAISAFIIILLINPYHFIHWETTYEQIHAVANKYGVGKKKLYIYPISYLYYYAVGIPAIWMSFLGILYTIYRKNYFRLILFMSPVMAGLYLFAYYSGGGFYTRNLLTISAFLLLFSAIGFNFLIDLVQSIVKNKFITIFVTVILILLISFDQIRGSTLIALSYTQKWNLDVLESWLDKNIPANAKIAAHSNVPLSIDGVVRLDYEEGVSFSIDEFSKNDAEYAIANFAWATNSFYWWMGGAPYEYILNYFNKPIDLMEYTYPAIALRELSESAIYSVSNPWQAPDTTFIVSKIPKYKIVNKSETVQYDFDKGEEGWKKSGRGWESKDNLSWSEDGLVLEAEPVLLPSTRWESPVIKVEDWNGFFIEYETNSLSDIKSRKGGYVFASFYKNGDDAEKSINRLGVRLSARKNSDSKWEVMSLLGTIPENAKYMTISYSSYDYVKTQNILKWMQVYKANVEVNYNGVIIKPFTIDSNDLFPNSHGNL